ncbi:tolloid-like protein 2 [Glandiceps talaboti]
MAIPVLFVLFLFSPAANIKFGCATVYMSEECGNTITSYGDRLRSQRSEYYTSNKDCTVTLTAPSGYSHLVLDIEWQDMEAATSTSCFDYVEIYDGRTTLSDLLIRDCGIVIPTDLYSSGSSLTLRFHTNNVYSGKGFSLIFTSFNTGNCTDSGEFSCSRGDICIDQSLVCDCKENCGNAADEQLCAPCEVYMDEHCGNNIASYGHRLMSQRSESYPHNIDCTVTIKTPLGSDIIALDFEWMDLERADVSSCYDYLEIYWGTSPSSYLRYRGCGSDTPLDIHSSGNAVTLRLVTGSENAHTGFSLIYTSYTTGSYCGGTGQFDCGNIRCIHTYLLCDCIDNCGNNKDEENCPDCVASQSGGLSDGAIVGIVIAVMVTFIIVTVLIYRMYTKPKQQQASIGPPPSISQNIATQELPPYSPRGQADLRVPSTSDGQYHNDGFDYKNQSNKQLPWVPT